MNCLHSNEYAQSHVQDIPQISQGIAILRHFYDCISPLLLLHSVQTREQCNYCIRVHMAKNISPGKGKHREIPHKSKCTQVSL